MIPPEPRHFGLYKESKLRGLQRKGRYSGVKSSQHSWAGQSKKCVQYDFQFTSEYSENAHFAHIAHFVFLCYMGGGGEGMDSNLPNFFLQNLLKV